MELDELRTAWTEQGRTIEAGVRLNHKLLTVLCLERAGAGLRHRFLPLVLEVAIDALVVAALGAFLYGHLQQPRFLVPALVLDLFAIVILANLVRQWITISSLDPSRGVAEFQRRLAELRVLRLRYVREVLLYSMVIWVPMFIVMFEGLLGVDVYRFLPARWLVANVALGLAVIPLGLWLSKRFGDRLARTAFIGSLVRAIAGRDLAEAERFVATVAEFEREPGVTPV